MPPVEPALFRVRQPEGTVTLRVDHDPASRLRSLARSGPWALSYTDRELAAALREPVFAFARAFSSAHVELDQLEALVRGAFRTASIERLPTTPRALPRWSGVLRCGAPGPDAVAPFDAESVALTLGLRGLVKRDGLAADEAAQARDWFGRWRFVTRTVPESDGRFAVFAAQHEALFDEVERAEASLGANAAGSDEAARWLGEALGYPACCVDAFLRISARHDAALAQALLPPLPAPSSSPLTLWIQPPLVLVSHAACSLACDATRRLGRAILEGLDHQYPGFAERWITLARRVHVVEADGTCWAMSCDGSLEEGVAVRDAVSSQPPRTALVSRPELVGARLSLRNDRVVAAAQGRELTFAFAADHRAALD